MNRWEYRVLVRGFDKNDNYIWTDKDQRSSEERLNAMGLEGWELIEVVTVHRMPLRNPHDFAKVAHLACFVQLVTSHKCPECCGCVFHAMADTIPG